MEPPCRKRRQQWRRSSRTCSTRSLRRLLGRSGQLRLEKMQGRALAAHASPRGQGQVLRSGVAKRGEGLRRHPWRIAHPAVMRLAFSFLSAVSLRTLECVRGGCILPIVGRGVLLPGCALPRILGVSLLQSVRVSSSLSPDAMALPGGHMVR